MILSSESVVKCFIIFSCLLVSEISSSEYFSSIIGLESLLKTEDVLVKDFRKYVELKKETINSLERELHKMETEHKLATSNADDYLTNPINVYLLMKRLHSDWYSYQERIRNDDADANFLKRLEVHKALLDFPDDYDMYGAALALMRLQSTYKLDVADIAAGKLNGIQYGTKMTWHDCYELGRQLHGAKEYNSTKLWLKESVKLFNKEEFARQPKALDFIETVAESLLELGDIQTAFNLSSEVVKLDAERSKAWDITYKAKNMLKNDQGVFAESENNDWQWNYYQTEEFKNYEKLCRSEINPTSTQQRHLRCRYFTNNKPYRQLAPFKIEEHSLDPLIITIHDVISSKKADTIREIATPHLTRSSVRAPGPEAFSNIRISKNAWIEYQSHPFTSDILHELHDVTGLDMSLCEKLQVANYGIGGHYEPHWDFYLPNEMSLIPTGEGNRIATAIFYLTDVAQGGATVFPHLNVAIWPHKGSVLFWYNLHHSLDRDYRTLHAGCPVLKGSKWIANVWVNDVTQTFSRPCLTQRDHEKSLEYETKK